MKFRSFQFYFEKFRLTFYAKLGNICDQFNIINLQKVNFWNLLIFTGFRKGSILYTMFLYSSPSFSKLNWKPSISRIHSRWSNLLKCRSLNISYFGKKLPRRNIVFLKKILILFTNLQKSDFRETYLIVIADNFLIILISLSHSFNGQSLSMHAKSLLTRKLLCILY